MRCCKQQKLGRILGTKIRQSPFISVGGVAEECWEICHSALS